MSSQRFKQGQWVKQAQLGGKTYVGIVLEDIHLPDYMVLVRWSDMPTFAGMPSESYHDLSYHCALEKLIPIDEEEAALLIIGNQ
jgi:hypothetical protein